jgi:serine/threonine protein kinase
MALPWRQAAGIGGAAVLLASIGLLGTSLRGKLYRSASQEAEWEARLLAQRASDEISLKARETEARVSAAASLNPVRALVTHSVDRATVVDAFATEEWWRSFREEFPVQVLITQGAKHDLGGQPAPDLEPLLAAARRKSAASQLMFANQRPYFAAAAVVEVPVPSPPGPSFLILARPFLAQDLTAPPFSGAVALSADKVALFGAGAPEQLQRLKEILGGDPSTPIVAADASWSAAAVELAPGLQLWVRMDTSIKSQEVSKTARGILGPLWGIALVLAASCLYLGFRRRHRPESSRSSSPEQPHRKLLIAPEVAVEPVDARRADGAPGEAPQAVVLSAVPTVAADANQFGRYRLLHVLGEGSTIRADLGVLRGVEGFSRLFVIKRLRPEVARQPSAVAEFVQRAQLGSSLVHSNIVPIYDFGRIDDEYFIAQEHILGRDLHAVLRRLKQREGRQLPPVLVFFIAQEILRALEYAHTHRHLPDEAAGVVLGNISPTKVLLSAMGEVKVVDFDIPQAKARANLVRPERAPFLSPEQARGEAIDARSDLFSLAMTMFWCLTGRTPYVVQGEQELLEKVKAGPGREERDLIGVFGGAATYVLQRALEAAPEKRFQTAEEFARAIPPWEMSRSGERLHSLMRKLFDEDFRAEQASHAEWQTGLDHASFSELPPVPSGEVRRIRRSR